VKVLCFEWVGLFWFGCFGFVLFCFVCGVFGCGVLWELCVLVVFCVGTYRWVASLGSRVSVVGCLFVFFCWVLWK
jgi:hypothetical protein